MKRNNLAAAISRLRKHSLAFLTLAAVWLLSVLAVRHYRQPGRMTVLESQAMDMTHMAVPPGAAPVATAVAHMAVVPDTVSYTGTVAPWNEEIISARVEGRLVSVPVYPGDAVAPGQIVARLDSFELSSRVAEAAAAADMARHNGEQETEGIRRSDSDVSVAKAKAVEMKHAVADAAANLQAAQSARVSAGADRDAAGQEVQSARAALTSAKADSDYWTDELAREAQLLKSGAVSRQEYQQEKAQAASADAKLRQAVSDVSRAEAGERSAVARIQAAGSAVASARAKLEQARASVGEADAGVSSALSALEIQRHRAYGNADAVRQAEAQLNTAAIVRGYTTIKSQAGGIVVDRLAAPGTLLMPGTPILRIASRDRVRLQANVAATDMGRIAVGDAVTAWVNGRRDRPIRARVTSVFPAADNTSRTSVVEAVVPSSGGFPRIGDYVTMQIGARPSGPVLAVPSESVVQTSTGPAVWTVSAANTAKLRKVAVGMTDGRQTAILSGLKDGDTVITQGQADLEDGMAVASVPWGTDGPAALPRPGAGISNRLAVESDWTASQPIGPLTGRLEVSPKPPSGDKDTTLTLHLTQNAQPVTDVHVIFQVEMTSMDMGVTTVNAATKGGGAYTGAVGLMSGPWRIRVTAKRGGSVVGTASYEVNVP